MVWCIHISGQLIDVINLESQNFNFLSIVGKELVALYMKKMLATELFPAENTRNSDV